MRGGRDQQVAQRVGGQSGQVRRHDREWGVGTMRGGPRDAVTDRGAQRVEGPIGRLLDDARSRPRDGVDDQVAAGHHDDLTHGGARLHRGERVAGECLGERPAGGRLDVQP